MIRLNEIERRLINAYQRDFPMESRPFARVAEKLGISEQEVIDIVARLQESGALCRVGAVVKPHTAGASTLAAVAAPAERLEEMADIISAQPEVTHNYEREHELNLWFVVTATDHDGVARALARIERLTGLEVLDLPLEKAYHIDLGFAL